jgi:hypothetical protein
MSKPTNVWEAIAGRIDVEYLPLLVKETLSQWEGSEQTPELAARIYPAIGALVTAYSEHGLEMKQSDRDTFEHILRLGMKVMS